MKTSDIVGYVIAVAFILSVGYTTGQVPFWDTLLFGFGVVLLGVMWIVTLIITLAVVAVGISDDFNPKKIPDAIKNFPFVKWMIGLVLLVGYAWAFTSAGWTTFATTWVVSTFVMWIVFYIFRSVLKGKNEPSES